MLNSVRLPLILVALAFVGIPSWSQTAPDLDRADALFREGKWDDAAGLYKQVVGKDPKNAYAWRQLGYSYYQLKRYVASIEALEREISLSPNPTSMYNVACAHALAGHPDKALEWLEKAVAGNLPPVVRPEQDADLASLYDHPRFRQLINEIDKKRRPCLHSEQSRQFDFWIGEWDVFAPSGMQVGTSVIEPVSEGCAVLERWTNRGGTTGTSINFYDSSTNKWHQYWMGPTGVATRYEGTFVDGAMRYHGERTTAGGGTILLRLTFTPLDSNTVRQFAEQSANGGKTWEPSYDFKYVRRKPVSP